MVYLLSNSQRTARAVPSVRTSKSSVNITSLDASVSYSIMVQATTAAGTSEELKSEPGEFESRSGSMYMAFANNSMQIFMNAGSV